MDNNSPIHIPLIRLIPMPVDEAGQSALGFRYAGDEVGHRHQLGGNPTWLQREDVPICSQCAKTMVFYGQLDSIGDKIIIADCGLIYVFMCFDCFHVEARVQSN